MSKRACVESHAPRIILPAPEAAAACPPLGIARYQRTFDKFDVDKSESLRIDELRAYMQSIDPSITEAQVQDTFISLDRNQSGLISWGEFLRSSQWTELRAVQHM